MRRSVPSLIAVKDLCRQLAIRPQRQAGQNFIIDNNIYRSMIESAEITKDDQVLEIGPGFGWLTEQLAQRAAKVIAVELEKRFIPWLTKHLPRSVTIVHNDIFKVNLSDYFEDGGYQLISSLPYGITAKVFRNFLTIKPRPKRLVLIIQKEVAERITAPAGRHSKLSVLVQRYSRPRLLKTVPADKFWPRPAVTSALVSCDVILDKDPDQDDDFWRLVTSGWQSARQQLVNNLARGLKISKDKAETVIKKARLSPKSRPQELKITDWDRLLEILVKDGDIKLTNALESDIMKQI
ncbi:MAG: 16S rRNA (adenine(1518)-N(6)/adenine(1519)-N(6))-dimethyltransferase RsmA [Patescibacteria group bacterium]